MALWTKKNETQLVIKNSTKKNSYISKLLKYHSELGAYEKNISQYLLSKT